MTLQSGLLISDPNPKTTFAEKVQAAVAAFEAKYGARPTLVQVHPSQAPEEGFSLPEPVADGCQPVVIEGSRRVSYPDYFMVVGPLPRMAVGGRASHGLGEDEV